MAKIFFLLSGEHETLPVSELRAVLEAEGCVYRTLERLDQVLRLETGVNCVEAVKRRAALTRLCGCELFNCEAETGEIVKAMRSIRLDEVLKEGESFAVRVRRVKRASMRIGRMALERKLGELILDKAADAKVNLRSPEKTFTGILTEERFVFGLKLAEIPPKPFVERRPRKKPFFHPSAMPAKLARCMVNLAEPKAGELVLDPFCGTGSMLIEAALTGCRVLGLDVQGRMVKGSRRNLAYFNIDPEGLVVGDARNMPVTKIDCVVTDPPYGRSATTLKRTTRQIIEEVLTSVHDLLDKGKRVCMAAPKTVGVGRIGESLGYKHLASHFVYVHRSLTREIAVFERV
ncbi:methyltransferase domain-containing protein [Candidatus Bathyarchaeota archaeon]|nr:methyltransferase domain-containing protein [Candidatus Bathyarchaeota archaeon]